jgi:hypothetical protein
MTEQLSTRWATAALAHARSLTAASPGRGSATAAEARASGSVQASLTNLGIPSRLQTFQGLRSIWLFVALGMGLALVGHAAYWLLVQAVNPVLAAGLSSAAFSLSGFLMWRKFTFQDYPLQETLPHGLSQNILAVLPPKEPIRQRVVLVAHLDSHRQVWLFANDILVRVYARLLPVGIWGLLLSPLCYLVASISGIQALAAPGLILAVGHFLAWFTGMTADLGPYSPGANDNAAAAGTLLALAERLKGEPLQLTEVWLAFTGCEETGCDGIRHLLKEDGETLKEAIFLDLELVGIGDRLVYLQEEGLVRRKKIPVQMEELALEAGKEANIQPFKTPAAGFFTENGTLWEKGFASICIISLRQENDLPPEWHRSTDVVERLELPALERTHDFIWKFLQIVDMQTAENYFKKA